MRRVRPLGASWTFLMLLKPESDLTESILRIDDCSFGFKESKFVTGHSLLDESIKYSTNRTAVWVDLFMLHDAAPKKLTGVPGFMDSGAVDWMMNLINLKAMLLHIASRDDFKDLKVDEAAGRLMVHLGKF